MPITFPWFPITTIVPKMMASRWQTAKCTRPTQGVLLEKHTPLTPVCHIRSGGLPWDDQNRQPGCAELSRDGPADRGGVVAVQEHLPAGADARRGWGRVKETSHQR